MFPFFSKRIWNAAQTKMQNITCVACSCFRLKCPLFCGFVQYRKQVNQSHSLIPDAVCAPGRNNPETMRRLCSMFSVNEEEVKLFINKQ